jgi:hypothetical protein
MIYDVKNVCAVAEDAHEKLAVADAKLGNAIQVSCISRRKPDRLRVCIQINW